MNKDLVRCSGIRTSWPYKGSPCGAWGKYEVGGKLYCGQHFATACLVAASSAKIAEEELDAICTRVQELRIEIVQINETIGRMFEKGNITADMIVEALNEKVDPDDHEWLKVIFNSWQENPQSKYEVIPQFSLILKTIRSYQ